MELYEWQKNCLDIWKRTQCRGIVDVTTAGGKTIFALVCASYLLEQYQDLHIRVVVHTKQLAVQWRKEILQFFPSLKRRDVQQYTFANKKKDARFTIYIINTARACIAGHIATDMKKREPTFLIVDECHHAASPANRNIFNFRNIPYFKDSLYFSLGLSATPDRNDYPYVLSSAIGPVIYRYQTEQASLDQIVNSYVILSTGVRLSGDEMDAYGNVDRIIRITYSKLLQERPYLQNLNGTSFFKELNTLAADDPECLASKWLQYIRQRRGILYNAENRLMAITDFIQHYKKEKIIIFTERIEHCDIIFKQLNILFPNKISHYHSGIDERSRKNNMDLFSLGETRILVTCRALDEGMDVPDASIGIVASSSSAQRQHIQRLGRIIRKGNRKPISLLYYLYIENTVEDPVFLASSKTDTTIYQHYLGKHDFICPTYEKAAEKAVLSLSKKFNSTFLSNCIDKAVGSGDWLYDERTYQQKIKNADQEKEKQYWIVMKEVHSQYLSMNQSFNLIAHSN